MLNWHKLKAFFCCCCFKQDLADSDTNLRWQYGHNATVDRNWISSLTE